jgi:excisionase family DNA binding protein
MAERLLSTREVAVMFGVDPRTVRAWAAEGRLPSERDRRNYRRFRLQDVLDAVQERAADGPPEG